jgi:enediyne biosynthesis protein E7
MKLLRPLLGQATEFARSPHGYPAGIALAAGGSARFRLYHRRAVAITDPDLAREVLIRRAGIIQRGRPARIMKLVLGDGLLTTDGELWRPTRHWLEPGFRREALLELVPQITALISGELDRWEAQARQQNGSIELVPALQSLLARLLSRNLLAQPWDEAQIHAFAMQIDGALHQMGSLLRQPWSLPDWWPGSTAGLLRRQGHSFDALLAPVLETDASLLQRLRPGSACPLGWRRRLDELKTLVAAAFETSTTTLTWTVDLLARHRPIQQLLQEEIDTTLAGRPLAADHLGRLEWCRLALMESMRLWPAVYNVVRECRQATQLGGLQLSAGEVVFVSIYGLHRHPELWDAPDQFRPQRFADHAVSHTGYLPFAIGPHSCLGKHLALLQMQCFLALLVQRFAIHSLDSDPPEASAFVTLRPRVSPRLRLIPRSR